MSSKALSKSGSSTFGLHPYWEIRPAFLGVQQGGNGASEAVDCALGPRRTPIYRQWIGLKSGLRTGHLPFESMTMWIMRSDTSPLQDVRSNTVGNPRGRFVHGFPCEMGVAASGLDLSMTEELPDHRQALPERQRPGGETVSQAMNSHVIGSARARMRRQGC